MRLTIQREFLIIGIALLSPRNRREVAEKTEASEFIEAVGFTDIDFYSAFDGGQLEIGFFDGGRP